MRSGRSKDDLYQYLFWKKVDIQGPEDHWLWLASRTKWGHGKFQSKLAHRVAWELYHGPIPDGKIVCHKKECGIAYCVNPISHTYLGTHSQNVQDSYDWGNKSNQGSKNHFASIDEETAQQIYECKGLMSGYEVAKIFGLSPSSIYRIWNNESWNHITF